MRHLKKFFEDYEDYEEDAVVDNKDMVHIIQDIKDMGFEVSMFVKYVAIKDVKENRVNFSNSLSPVKFENSHKCYQIDIRRALTPTSIEDPMVDVLSDFFYELQTVFSRLSEVGEVISCLNITTSRWSPTYTSCVINLIVITDEVVEEGDGNDKKLIDALVKAGFKPVRNQYSKEYIEIQDIFPTLNQPNNLYTGNNQDRERARAEWALSRSTREVEIKKVWANIKKIARKENINVRWRSYLRSYTGLSFKLDKGKDTKIDTNLKD